MIESNRVTSGSHNGDASAYDWKRFQQPNLPLVTVGPDGIITHISAPARKLLEIRADQAVESSFFSIIHGRQLYQVMRDIADMVTRGKQQATWLIRLRTADGRWKWFKADVFNQMHTSNRVVSIVLHAV